MKLVPVDHDPFADASAAPTTGPRLVPVDHDPFAPADASAQAGPLPPLEDGGAGLAVTRGLINGIPVAGPYILGGMNRVAAGVRSLANDTKFSDELKRVEEVSDRTAKQRPITTGVSEVAGGIAGTLPMVAAAPAAFGAGAAGIGARSAASAFSGAVLGGADAAVRSNGDANQSWKGLAAGGALGAVAPAAGALVGAGVRKAAEAIGTRAAPSAGMGSGAMGKLAADAENAGGPAAVRARMDELGPEAMLLDASPSFEGRAQGLAILPDTREAVMAPLTARAKGANARLGGDVDRTLGPATDPAAFKAATDADYAQAVPPLYRQAFAQPVTVDTSGVLSTIGRISEQEKGGASQALERAWRLLHTEADLPGIGRAMVPDRRPEALHNAKEALDAMIAQVQAQQGSAAASELRALAMVRSGVNEALEAQVPGYADANRTAQRFFQQRDAFDQGQTLLNGGREAIRPDQLAAERAAMAPGVQDAQRLGLRAEVDRLVGTRLNDRLALRQALMGEGDYNRARMGTVFGEEPTAGLAAAVEREAAFDAAHQRINNNAMTAMRLRAADDIAPREVRAGSGDIGTVVAGAAGGVKGVAAAYGIKGAKMAADAAGRARDVARNKELADAVTMRRGEQLDRLLAAIEARMAAESSAAGIGRAAGLATQSGLLSQSDRVQPYVPFGFLPR